LRSGGVAIRRGKQDGDGRLIGTSKPAPEGATRAVADDLADVGRAIRWVGDRLSDASFNGDLRYGIEVCLEEALVNLILHGRGDDAGKDIALAVRADEGAATIVISDRCVPFDVAHEASPQPSKAGKLREGGQGLRLLRAFATELAYASENGRNVLTLRFHADAAAPAPAS
jgi:anti-sigma regulatory factor (Ser/Thr protein kinase)